MEYLGSNCHLEWRPPANLILSRNLLLKVVDIKSQQIFLDTTVAHIECCTTYFFLGVKMSEIVKHESSASVDFDTMQRMSKAVVESGLFGVKTVAQALSLMMISQAEGRHPALCALEYHIVKGRPTLSADAMLARFQRNGGSVRWLKYTDTEVVGEFTHPQGGSLTIDWTMERAKTIGLVKADSGWAKYPRNMLRARCVSEGIRAVYPSICTGVYTPEEVKDMGTEAIREVVASKPSIPSEKDIEEFKADMIDAGLWKYINSEQQESLALHPSWSMIDAVRQTAVFAKRKSEQPTITEVQS